MDAGALEVLVELLRATDLRETAQKYAAVAICDLVQLVGRWILERSLPMLVRLQRCIKLHVVVYRSALSHLSSFARRAQNPHCASWRPGTTAEHLDVRDDPQQRAKVLESDGRTSDFALWWVSRCLIENAKFLTVKCIKTTTRLCLSLSQHLRLSPTHILNYPADSLHHALIVAGFVPLLARMSRLTFGNTNMPKYCMQSLVRIINSTETIGTCDIRYSENEELDGEGIYFKRTSVKFPIVLIEANKFSFSLLINPSEISVLQVC